MQESGVSWDPVTVCYGGPPWYVRAYLLYLGIIVCASIVRSIRIGARVWSFRGRKRAASREPQVERGIEALTRSALNGTLWHQDRKKLSSAGTVDSPRSANVIDQIDVCFTFQWRLYYQRVRGMKRIVVATFLFAVFIATAYAADFFQAMSIQKTVGTGLWSVIGSEALTVFAAGILVCLLVYVAAVILEGILERRRAHWNYTYATLKERET